MVGIGEYGGGDGGENDGDDGGDDGEENDGDVEGYTMVVVFPF